MAGRRWLGLHFRCSRVCIQKNSVHSRYVPCIYFDWQFLSFHFGIFLRIADKGNSIIS